MPTYRGFGTPLYVTPGMSAEDSQRAAVDALLGAAPPATPPSVNVGPFDGPGSGYGANYPSDAGPSITSQPDTPIPPSSPDTVASRPSQPDTPIPSPAPDASALDAIVRGFGRPLYVTPGQSAAQSQRDAIAAALAQRQQIDPALDRAAQVYQYYEPGGGGGSAAGIGATGGDTG